MISIKKTLLNSKYGKTLQVPSGFTYTPDFSIMKVGNKYSHNFNIEKYKNTPSANQTYYVDVTNGSDVNNGLSLEHAFKTIKKAYDSITGNGTIYLADGLYNTTNAMNDTTITKNVNIIALPNHFPILSAEKTETWTLTAGKTNTYEATEESTIYRVFDGRTPDSNGDHVELTKKSSINAVESTPGSWYYTSGKLYVHTINNRTPDSDIHSYLAVNNIMATDINLYLEGITIYGGGSSSTSSSGPISHTSTTKGAHYIAMKNCVIKYSINLNKGVYVLRSNAYVYNCISAKNESDGYNYYNCGIGIEVDCVGRNNGILGAGSTDNGSSAHYGTMLRLNGKYYNNSGPNVPDVLTGILSWVIGCESHDSVNIYPATQSDFHIENGTMWIEGCTNKGSTSSFGLIARNDGILYVKSDCELVGPVTGVYTKF